MHGPFASPDTLHPVRLPDGSPHLGTVFLRPAIRHPRWRIGDYSYASAHRPPEDWAAHLAPYLYEFSSENLVIGRFCQIADGVQFITASANHRHDGFTSYPFAIFGGGGMDGRASLPAPGADTVIGHDVWIGTGARILPGARIGTGSIVGAGAVVGGAIPPYSVVVGNPGRVSRGRFAAEVIDRLLALAWWDWPIERILSCEGALCSGDPALLDRPGRE